MIRGIRGIRLSVLTDETTSPERQRHACESVEQERGITCVGEAVDLGVSASKTAPLERPELGAWMRRPSEFDALVFWRMDRAVRSMDDMHALAKWCRDHRKLLVIAEGPGGRLVLDFRSALDPVTQLLTTVFAFAAQMEAISIQERVGGAQSALRAMPLRWRGTTPPYGYRPTDMPTGAGRTLEPDPEAVEVIERVIREMREGRTLTDIAVRLTKEGVPSPRDYWAAKQGRPTKGMAWSQRGLRHILRSPTIMGYKVHAGSTVRDAAGQPVPSATAPVLTREEYDAIGALVAARSIRTGVRSDTTSLLLGIAYCTCGSRMYGQRQAHHTSARAPLYRCAARVRGRPCAAPASARMDWLEERVGEVFLGALGHVQATRTVVVPGYDPAVEIEETSAEYTAHMEERGRQRSRAARDAWQRRADALDARLADLESREARPERVEREAVDSRTYIEMWDVEQVEGRRRLLAEAGVRVTVAKSEEFRPSSLDTERVSFEITDEWHREAAEHAEVYE